MSWTRPTIQTIYDRIKADIENYVTDGVPVPRVSMLGILASVFAGGIHLCYGFLEWIKKQIFVDTASAWGRERWANILGIPRKPATYSTGFVRFSGTTSKLVPEGTLLVNGEGYEYETLDDFTITDPPSDEVECQATDAGADSNTDDAYLTLSSPDPDIDSDVEVVVDPDSGAASFQNGVNQESIESWVLRFLYRFQNPPGCGNAADYVRWALEVPGVGRAWCVPAEIWGQGSVGVYVAKDNLEPVAESVRQAVADYIEGTVDTEMKRPVPAFVEYYTITEMKIRLTISITPFNSELQESIEEALQKMFLQESGPGHTILISHIMGAIHSVAPDDYEITGIDEYDSGWSSIGVGNIESNYPDTPTLETVVFNELT